MSRYDDYSFPHRPRPTERWDGDRFARERYGGGPPVAERDRYQERDSFRTDGRGGFSSRREVEEDDYQRRRGGGYEDDRFYEREERYGPPARRAPPREQVDRRYYEEEEYDSYRDDRRPSGRRAAPPRPGQLIRRQSSLDTFDRRPQPRYHEPEVIGVPSPRGGRHGQERHRYEPRYAERDYYEDIRIAEPDRYGDEDFRGWKEREIETIRRRRPEPRREEIDEEIVEEVVETEKPWPRRGKTRMSARLVNKRALVHLGYPYEDEFSERGDYVIILKALNKELIDEVLGVSKEFNERVTLALEAPPAQREEIIERKEIVIDGPGDIPRSVREWDQMSGTIKDDNKSVHKSERLTVHGSVAGRSKHSRSKSAHGGRSEHVSEHHGSHHGRKSSRGGDTVIKIGSREGSPVVIERRRSKSRRRSRHGSTVIKADIIEDEEIGESNSMHPGPLAMVMPHHDERRHKEDRHKDDILELEIEKRRLKRERRERRHRDDSDDEVIIERVRSRSRDRRGSGKVERERDRKDSKAVKAMLATLT